MSIAAKLLITFGVLFYLVVIPVLEWNQSHVFNEQWPPHARFHEVWQLTSNIALGVAVLWLSWFRSQIKIAAMISCCVMGGVIVSHLLSGHSGGSVQSGNISKYILGLDLAVFVAIVVCLTALLAVFVDEKDKSN